jgi:hypothetical protein
MVQEFRALLDDPNAGFGIRSVIVDALSLGQPIPEMLPDLEAIVVREASPFAERAQALNALLRTGEPGKAAAIAAFQKLGKSGGARRLRSEIILAFYGEKFGVSDVVALVNESLDADDTVDAGIFNAVADQIPVQDLSAVLDGVDAPPANDQPGLANWEGGNFYSRILVRAWQSPDGFDAGCALGWLRKPIAFKRGASERRARGLQAAMAETPRPAERDRASLLQDA